MSIDNSAILFYGLPEEEMDFEGLTGFDEERYESDGEYYLQEWFEAETGSKVDISEQETDDDEVGHLIGVKLGDSGSYGIKQLAEIELLNRMLDLKYLFQLAFGRTPRIYLFNYNW